MDGYHFSLADEADFRPLTRLLELADIGATLCPNEFMFAGVLRSSKARDIHLFKHVRSRRYLCLDACGHAYETSSEGDNIRCSLVSVHDALRSFASMRS